MTDVDASAEGKALAIVIPELVADSSDDEAIYRRLDANGRKELVLIRNVQLPDELCIGNDRASTEENRRLNEVAVLEQVDGGGDVAVEGGARAE